MNPPMTPAHASFDDWFRRARPKLLRLASSRLRDADEAEDVVQDTALAVWRAHSEGRVKDLEAYASRSVWQNAIKRSTRRRRFEPLEQAELEGWGAPAEADDWIEAAELERAIAELPLAQQAVLRLRFYAGLSFRETADALKIGLNTAASRCRYALGSLREGLGKNSEENDGSADAKRTKGAGKPAGAELRQRKRRGGGGRP